jgi:hypothetical protein
MHCPEPLARERHQQNNFTVRSYTALCDCCVSMVQERVQGESRQAAVTLVDVVWHCTVYSS